MGELEAEMQSSLPRLAPSSKLSGALTPAVGALDKEVVL